MKKLILFALIPLLSLHQLRADHELSAGLKALSGVFFSIPVSNTIWSWYARTKTQRFVELQGQLAISMMSQPNNSELQKIYQKEQEVLFAKLQRFNKRSAWVNWMYKKMEISLGISDTFDPGLWNYLFVAFGTFALSQVTHLAGL